MSPSGNFYTLTYAGRYKNEVAFCAFAIAIFMTARAFINSFFQDGSVRGKMLDYFKLFVYAVSILGVIILHVILFP